MSPIDAHTVAWSTAACGVALTAPAIKTSDTHHTIGMCTAWWNCATGKTVTATMTKRMFYAALGDGICPESVSAATSTR